MEWNWCAVEGPLAHNPQHQLHSTAANQQQIPFINSFHLFNDLAWLVSLIAVEENNEKIL